MSYARIREFLKSKAAPKESIELETQTYQRLSDEEKSPLEIVVAKPESNLVALTIEIKQPPAEEKNSIWKKWNLVDNFIMTGLGSGYTMSSFFTWLFNHEAFLPGLSWYGMLESMPFVVFFSWCVATQDNPTNYSKARAWGNWASNVFVPLAALILGNEAVLDESSLGGYSGYVRGTAYGLYCFWKGGAEYIKVEEALSSNTMRNNV